MTINDEITAIANQIANNGQKPSVALIKNKLSTPAPLPQIISVLKSWTHDPKLTQITVQQAENTKIPTKQNEDVEAIIQKAIAPLHIEIKVLREAIEALSKKIK